LSHNADRVVLRNYEGKIFEYPEAPDGTPLSPPPKEIEEPELVWIPGRKRHGCSRRAVFVLDPVKTPD